MGSLIPSELWDWHKHWRFVAGAVALALFLFGIIVVVTLLG